MLALITLSSLISALLMIAFHPMMIMLLVILQTLAVCLIIWLKMITAWFSFILFLIFMGGVMVLFVYITSLAANEMFYFSLYWTTKQTYMMAALTFLTSTTLFWETPYAQSHTTLNTSLHPMFGASSVTIISFIVAYLLITLIVVVKLASKTEGPLRNLLM